MDLANLMHLTNMEMGLIILEGSILLSFLFTLITVKRALHREMTPKRPSSHPDQLREWVQDAEAICRALSKNLEEKKEIAGRVVSQLDERIQTLQVLLKRVDEDRPSYGRGDNQKDLDARIFKMAEAGCDVSEIARQLRLPKGEIQLALDLKRYRQ